MKELTLGDRMKTYYESRSQTYLTRYTPAVIRLSLNVCRIMSKSSKNEVKVYFYS